MLLFNLVCFASLYTLLRLQYYLPFNPQGMTGMAPALALNTAVSFTTNTNWQNCGGETTLGYFPQMARLTVHNFVSAATGMAICMPLIRGFARRSLQSIRNFWADLVRCTLYILLPISVVFALFFVWQGIPQNLNVYVDGTTLEGPSRQLPRGPVASQLVIKMLGTNGGGFFNVDSAHPTRIRLRSRTSCRTVLIFSLSASLTNVFGRMVSNRKQGWALFGAIGILSLAGALIAYQAESAKRTLVAELAGSAR
jgi:K+-transporting ATPase ATPase A chain